MSDEQRVGKFWRWLGGHWPWMLLAIAYAFTGEFGAVLGCLVMGQLIRMETLIRNHIRGGEM